MENNLKRSYTVGIVRENKASVHWVLLFLCYIEVERKHGTNNLWDHIRINMKDLLHTRKCLSFCVAEYVLKGVDSKVNLQDDS